jgi:hypothetical protein
MDFTGATNNPSVIPTNSATIAGNLTLISTMSWGNTGASITFDTTGTTATLTTAGVTLRIANVIISGSGTFNLGSDVTITNGTSGAFKPTGSGIVNTNNYNLTTLVWQDGGSSTSTINLGSSTITLNVSGSGISAWIAQAGETINPGTSAIVLTGNTVTFAGGGKTYYDVLFTGSPTTISGANTFNSLNVSAGKTVNFPSGVGQTITTLNAVGSSGSNILFRSTSSGSQTSLCVTNWNLAYVDAKDVNANCATAIDCTGTNSGNNSGFDFCTGRAFLLNLI